jgi:hypothetical protein
MKESLIEKIPCMHNSSSSSDFSKNPIGMNDSGKYIAHEQYDVFGVFIAHEQYDVFGVFIKLTRPDIVPSYYNYR